MKIIHFADLHLGVETYGRIDPVTGVSSRLDDFLSALDQLVDYALDNSVDLVLFCGDAYKSREPGQTQQREFARRINRLVTNNIPIFILVGNHDMPNAIGKATSTEIFDALAIENVYVSNRPAIHRIPTRSGTVQIASLPWLRRSALLSKEETKNLDLEQINQKLQEALTAVVADHAAKIDPSLPAILAAHVWVTGAEVGSERTMTIGQEHVLMPGNVAHPAFDYVALGHIHRHQVLSANPPVVYAGSLERVDFGEEADEKGFYLVEIGDRQDTGQRPVAYDFKSVRGRRFLTINVDIDAGDADATRTVLGAIAGKAEDVAGAVVRLRVSLPAELDGQLRDSEIREALKGASYLNIAREVRRENRLRLGKFAAEEIPPLEALKKYLEAKKVSPERARVMLEYGEKLIREKDTGG